MRWDMGSDGQRPNSSAFEDQRPTPTQHRLQTPHCATLSHLLSTPAWTRPAEERRHTAACPWCQKVLAMAWRQECPGVGQLVVDLAGSSSAAAAMREHLEEDRCPRCRRLMGSALLGSAAAALREGRRSVQALEVWLGQVVAVSTPLPAGAGSFAGFDRGPFRVRAESPGGLVTVVRQTDRGLVVVETESSDPSLAGRHVRVEILGDGEPLEVDLVLRAEGGRSIARHTVGRFSELRSRLGGSCEVVAALASDASGS
jgi:hypothetical protein